MTRPELSAAFRHTALSAAALCSLTALLPLEARAEHTVPTLRETSSIRSKGMGDATRSFASGDEALWVNPAGMSALPRFNVGASLAFEVPKDRGLRQFTLSAIDSQLNADTIFPLGGGISYSYYRSGYGEEKRSGSVVLLGLSLPLVHENFTLGITGKWLKLTGANEIYDTNAVTMDAGIIVRPIELLSLGAVGYNLIDVSSPEARRAWGFGLSVGTDKTFIVSADMKLEQRSDEDKKWRISFGVGGELHIRNMFVPRIGYERDTIRDTHKVGGGLSVFVSRVAIEAVYQYIFEGSHYFGLAVRVVNFG